MGGFINALKYSLNKRLRFWNKSRTFRKYGDLTKYHLVGPRYSIGEHTYGIPEVHLYGSENLTIGAYSSIARNVNILLGGNHPMHISTFPFYKESTSNVKYCKWGGVNLDLLKGDVVIGNDVWIGFGVTILSGVTIGDGAIIGAGAVVSKDIPPYAIAVGNPIKIIRYRFFPEQIEDLLDIKWWNWPEEKVTEFLPLIGSKDISAFIEKAKLFDLTLTDSLTQ